MQNYLKCCIKIEYFFPEYMEKVWRDRNNEAQYNGETIEYLLIYVSNTYRRILSYRILIFFILALLHVSFQVVSKKLLQFLLLNNFTGSDSPRTFIYVQTLWGERGFLYRGQSTRNYSFSH